MKTWIKGREGNKGSQSKCELKAKSVGEKKPQCRNERWESPQEWRKSRCEGRIGGRKGKQRVRATVNLGQLRKMCRTVIRASQRGHISRS